MNKDESRSKQPEVYDSVVEGLKNVYKSKILPLEQNYLFHDFHSPALDDPDFDARPMILLVGQYSTGKTTFIRYLLEKVSEKSYDEKKSRYLAPEFLGFPRYPDRTRTYDR